MMMRWGDGTAAAALVVEAAAVPTVAPRSISADARTSQARDIYEREGWGERESAFGVLEEKSEQKNERPSTLLLRFVAFFDTIVGIQGEESRGPKRLHLSFSAETMSARDSFVSAATITLDASPSEVRPRKKQARESAWCERSLRRRRSSGRALRVSCRQTEKKTLNLNQLLLPPPRPHTDFNSPRAPLFFPQVYDLLSDLSTWTSWRRNPFSGCLLGAVTAGGRDRLGVGDRFGTMSAPAALGVVPLPVRQQVTRADGRSRLAWEDDAVWGLAAGKRSFRLERGRTEVVREKEEEEEKKKGWFFSLGGGGRGRGGGGGGGSRRHERTKVTVEHEREHGGLPAVLAPAFAMERANARWLLDLKKAVESKRKQEDKERKLRGKK